MGERGQAAGERGKIRPGSRTWQQKEEKDREREREMWRKKKIATGYRTDREE